MAFKASNVIPDKAFTDAKSIAVSVKRTAQRSATDFTSIGGDSNDIFGLLSSLLNNRERLFDLRDTPGLGAYAQEQESDGTYDVVAEFNAMIALIDATTDALIAAIPKDGSGYLLMETINAEGSRVPRTFTVGNLSGIKDLLVALVAGIE